ncbi:carboxymuconolactone decarboxylase family protein [Thioalkalivibrio sp.]|uniref:carboxymuconolactone decarboxylase family protein n=1 Tax=Thioalkalivibrio sp. TaxID=2093813 RepID=UPI003974B2B3
MMADTNDDGARGILRQVARTFDDAVPNLYRTLADSPVALETFVRFEEILERRGSLSRDEHAIVALEVALLNDCAYCRGVFSREAREAGVGQDTLEAVLDGLDPGRIRYRVLLSATRRLMSEKGRLGRAEVTLLEERGLPFGELLEIIAIIGAFTVATYANNLAHTRIDPEYR